MGNSLDEQLDQKLRQILADDFYGNGTGEEEDRAVQHIHEAFKNAGYEKKHQILYGTKYKKPKIPVLRKDWS